MPLTRVVSRRRGGGVSVRLPRGEHDLLRSLSEQLRPLLTGELDEPRVRRRLNPPAYEGAAEEAEYRELVGDSLVAERVTALDAFARTLGGGTVRRGIWTVELDAGEAAAWLSTVNDARLVLGALQGITTESDWEHGPDPEHPQSVALYYLGLLEEELVDALMRARPHD